MANKTIIVRGGWVASIRKDTVSIFRNKRRGGRFCYQVKHAGGNEKPCLEIEDAVEAIHDKAFAVKIVTAFKMHLPNDRELRALFPTFGVIFENRARQRRS